MTGTPDRLLVRVVAQQALALGVEAEISYYTSSHNHVPGSVLRGALAARWIAENGPPTAGNENAGEFRELFDGRVRYGALHVDGASRVPLSVARCKYPTTETCGQSVVDKAFEGTPCCLGCGERLEPSKGEVELPDRVRMRRTTRTAIGEDGVAEDGSLFAQGALPAGTALSGFIVGHHPWLEAERILWLGGRRTVGGEATYVTTPADPPPPPALTPDSALVLRLLTPAIFVDVAGRASLNPDQTLDLGGEGVTCERAWTRAEVRSGWHAASRLPKPSDLCAAAGSTYRITGPEPLLTALAARLAADGVGLRRTEGFGLVEIAHERWRPPEKASTAVTPSTTVTTAGGPAEEAFATLRGLSLKDGWRWVFGTLRRLQVWEESHSGDERTRGEDRIREERTKMIGELLREPAAVRLPAPTRHALRELFISTTGTVLRDLTMLVAADSHVNAEEDPR